MHEEIRIRKCDSKCYKSFDVPACHVFDFFKCDSVLSLGVPSSHFYNCIEYGRVWLLLYLLWCFLPWNFLCNVQWDHIINKGKTVLSHFSVLHFYMNMIHASFSLPTTSLNRSFQYSSSFQALKWLNCSLLRSDRLHANIDLTQPSDIIVYNTCSLPAVLPTQLYVIYMCLQWTVSRSESLPICSFLAIPVYDMLNLWRCPSLYMYPNIVL